MRLTHARPPCRSTWNPSGTCWRTTSGGKLQWRNEHSLHACRSIGRRTATGGSGAIQRPSVWSASAIISCDSSPRAVARCVLMRSVVAGSTLGPGLRRAATTPRAAAVLDAHRCHERRVNHGVRAPAGTRSGSPAHRDPPGRARRAPASCSASGKTRCSSRCRCRASSSVAFLRSFLRAQASLGPVAASASRSAAMAR
jgi:hypothetical protein